MHAGKGCDGMTSQNICKFITPNEAKELSATNFVYETRAAQAHKSTLLPVHRVHVVADGEGVYKCAGQCYVIEAGMLFFSFADVPFTIENTAGLKYYYISFSGQRADELFSRFGVTPERCIFHGFESMTMLLHDNLVRADQDNIDLLCESIVLQIFSRLKEAKRDSGDVASAVLTEMENRYTESDLSLERIADAVGYNSKYISRVFKKRFNMSFTEYLRLMRVKHAMMLMESGVTCVKNAAFLSGFSDPLYFSKVFTRLIGMPPRDYIQANSGRDKEAPDK